MAELTEAGTTGLTAPTPTQSMMAKDFPDPPVPPSPAAEPPVAPSAPAPPQKFTRDIDLKDGSGVQHFEAETWEGLVDKLATAQEHATRKIRELSQRPKIEPEREVAAPKGPKELSAAELVALKESGDPVAIFNKLFEARMGRTPEQVSAELNEFDSTKQRQEAERSFVAKHKDDFYNCPENAQKISAFLNKENLPVTKRNLEYAFQEIGDGFTKKAEPVTANLPPPPPAPGQPVTREIPPPPVTIPANFGERVEVRTDAGGVDAAEYAKIAAMPPDQMKARIEQLFRSQRGQAR